MIVTQNLDDFPPPVLAEYDIEAQHPDDFVVNVMDLDLRAVCQVVEQQMAALKNPPKSQVEVLDTLKSQGLVQTVAILRRVM